MLTNEYLKRGLEWEERKRKEGEGCEKKKIEV